jgi:hypothetical protein
VPCAGRVFGAWILVVRRPRASAETAGSLCENQAARDKKTFRFPVVTVASFDGAISSADFLRFLRTAKGILCVCCMRSVA